LWLQGVGDDGVNLAHLLFAIFAAKMANMEEAFKALPKITRA
jgi:hypothetical protein